VLSRAVLNLARPSYVSLVLLQIHVLLPNRSRIKTAEFGSVLFGFSSIPVSKLNRYSSRYYAPWFWNCDFTNTGVVVYSLSQLPAEELGERKQNMSDLPRPVQDTNNHQVPVRPVALSIFTLHDGARLKTTSLCCLDVCPYRYACPSRKSFSDWNEIWCVGRGR